MFGWGREGCRGEQRGGEGGGRRREKEEPRRGREEGGRRDDRTGRRRALGRAGFPADSGLAVLLRAQLTLSAVELHLH